MPLHTQREEDIKNYQDSLLGKRIEASEVFFINHGFPEWKGETIPDFISNIYIKIAERRVTYWQQMKDKLQKQYEDTDMFSIGGALAIATTELELAQEELNKLKS